MLYFSLTGKTKLVAETIAKNLNTDIQEINPEKPYPQVDPLKIDWNMLVLSLKSIFHSKPKIQAIDKSVKDYDLCVLALPVWANNIAPPFNTFLQDLELEQKNAAIVLTVDARRTSEHIILDISKKLSARGATIIQQDTVPVIGVNDSHIVQNALEVAERLRPVVEISKQKTGIK